MFENAQIFSSFSVNDLAKAKEFYGKKLGLHVQEEGEMGLALQTADGRIFCHIYPKDDHEPATFTVLNFPVDDIDKAVDELKAKGIELEHYEGFGQDETGIARSDSPEKGPNIAWFKDPAGNVLSILQ